MDYLNIYLGLGCLLSTYLGVYYLLSRQTIADPISIKSLPSRVILVILAWPFLMKVIFSKDIKNLISVPKPFLPDLDESYRSRMTQNEVFWNVQQQCGQLVSIKSDCESNGQLNRSTFIFEPGELAACLFKRHISMAGLDNAYEDKDLVYWLKRYRADLPVVSVVPRLHDDYSFNIIKAVQQGIGEGFCSSCNKTYSANQLTVQEPRYEMSYCIQTIECPTGHTMLYHEGFVYFKTG